MGLKRSRCISPTCLANGRRRKEPATTDFLHCVHVAWGGEGIQVRGGEKRAGECKRPR